MRKCHYEGSDPYLALLNYRSTPIPELKASPARLLMSRNLKTRLPTASALLQPDVITNISENLRARQHRQKYYYDRQAQPMRELEAEEVVCIQRDKQWEPAVVTQKHTAPRSYIVTQNGRSLRRNRRHIHPTLGAPPNQNQEPALDDYLSRVNTSSQTDKPRPSTIDDKGEQPTLETYRTSSGREVRGPKKLDDYV
ncbi:uncharacterized protein LOC134190170 [Corticium candelabrum]|uniref:uncharacterized protein LOC134190170 n=1 Tax=Corticium candelabrum TaxID=121492 RepID=UPI002E2552C5|nr:uncharacterized protein LOC134190170 [Corticium candelabrum]